MSRESILEDFKNGEKVREDYVRENGALPSICDQIAILFPSVSDVAPYLCCVRGKRKGRIRFTFPWSLVDKHGKDSAPYQLALQARYLWARMELHRGNRGYGMYASMTDSYAYDIAEDRKDDLDTVALLIVGGSKVARQWAAALGAN